MYNRNNNVFIILSSVACAAMVCIALFINSNSKNNYTSHSPYGNYLIVISSLEKNNYIPSRGAEEMILEITQGDGLFRKIYTNEFLFKNNGIPFAPSFVSAEWYENEVRIIFSAQYMKKVFVYNLDELFANESGEYSLDSNENKM